MRLPTEPPKSANLKKLNNPMKTRSSKPTLPPNCSLMIPWASLLRLRMESKTKLASIAMNPVTFRGNVPMFRTSCSALFVKNLDTCPKLAHRRLATIATRKVTCPVDVPWDKQDLAIIAMRRDTLREIAVNLLLDEGVAEEEDPEGVVAVAGDGDVDLFNVIGALAPIVCN